jgi:ribosome assembly protein 4
MVSGSGDNTARIWDTDTGTGVFTLTGHTSWVLAVSWSPDDSKIATGSMDNTVRIWNPATGKPLGSPMKGHSKWVTSLAWEPYHAQKPGEPRLASASKDSTVRIWSTNQQTIEMVLSGHKGSVSCVKWGGTGLIYTGSHDKTVKVIFIARSIQIMQLLTPKLTRYGMRRMELLRTR